ncbi:hypothetical protein BDW02DRAFT_566380 [Decorospora gaudefroyi]|uniref:F-box domain-containing protein n=1 Tax=Decorospora gaudefroyi TaxID=184978 RepID=A0A6A5KU21_9PLEO|nr:hypothetical protein BDW02DRAFT_566380 [Decorospora gaudefroyi]
MLSLICRKVFLNTATSNRFLQLPDDVLILIFGYCRVDELLALRLTSQRIRVVVDAYISTIAPAVARTTFPHCHRLLRPPDNGSQRDLRWLLALIPGQLAAILVDRHRLAFLGEGLLDYGISAEDARGDKLRARVTNGWHVLRRLSNISREVYSTYTKHSLRRRELVQQFLPNAPKGREELILLRRVEYINGLPEQKAADYKLMTTLLSSVFTTFEANVGNEHSRWIFDSTGGIDGQREFRFGRSWLSWFMLQEGPDLFWDQWWRLPPDAAQNHIRDRATKAFKALPPGLASDQSSLAEEVQKAVHERAQVLRNTGGTNPFAYFYQRRGTMAGQAAEEPVKETMEHVPFLVNFRCPEEKTRRLAWLLGSGAFEMELGP